MQAEFKLFHGNGVYGHVDDFILMMGTRFYCLCLLLHLLIPSN